MATAQISSEQYSIERLQAGDSSALESLYRLHKRRVYTLCLRMTRNVSDAEDLTQEVFLQVWRKISSFRSESAFSTWLHAVTVSIVLMHFRASVHVPLFEACSADQENDVHAVEIVDHDLRLNHCVDRLSLERAIDSLPSGYRVAFILHDIEGYEHK